MSVTIEREYPRTQILKKRLLDAQYSICIERARCYTETFRETEGEHPSIRAACALENTLRSMTIFIDPDEQIAGNLCSRTLGAVLPVERGELNLILQIDLKNLERREQRPYHIDPADKNELLRDILPYWKGKTVRDMKYRNFKRDGLLIKSSLSPFALYDIVRSFGLKTLKESLYRFVEGKAIHALRAMKEIPVNNPNLVNNVFDVQGHLIIGHNNIIQTGFSGVRDHALENMKRAESEDRRKFLEGVVISCESARSFAERFSELAREQAAAEENPRRREELLRIADITSRLPWQPPRDFREAVQFFWLTQVMAVVSYGMPGVCAVGRIDQYLYPFYKADIESGAIDRDAALELVEELLVKLSNNLIVLPTFGKDTGSELGADSMAPTIGGLGRDGADATNDLSFIFMDAIINMRAMSNSYSVRVSNRTAPEFFAKISEVHSVTSGLAVFNDEVIVPALAGDGCGIEDARDYGIIGCVEPTPQGNTFGCTSGNDVSLVGALEMTFTGGRVRMAGRRAGPQTGDVRGFETFDQFVDAYKKQLAWAVDFIARCVNAKDEVYMNHFHNPMISLTLDGCVESGRDMTEGGAKYNFSSISGRGLGTAADSLTAIKKFVYDDKKITMQELLNALKTNYRGRENLRVMLERRTPRYGADDSEADEMARMIAGALCDEVGRHRSIREGGLFRPGFFSYGMHVMDGSMLGATPDGRPAGKPVSNSLSPSNGAETLGPTATMLSAAKIDQQKISNGCALNMKMLPALLRTEEGRLKFEAMLKAYFASGGMHVQINVVDDAMLRDAQLHPENYMDLIVRVSGYVAYFVDLGKPLQDDIIRRTMFSGF